MVALRVLVAVVAVAVAGIGSVKATFGDAGGHRARTAGDSRSNGSTPAAAAKPKPKRPAGKGKSHLPPLHRAHPLSFPAAGHIWGGNSNTAYRVADVVITNYQNDPSEGRAIAKARRTNPGLIALWAPVLDPGKADPARRRGFQATYGTGLIGWPGVRDRLTPKPQGRIRGWRSADYGCMQADGIRGFNLSRPSTAEFIKQAYYYAWKLNKARARGFDGIWSDNLVPGAQIKAPWFYGPSCPISKSAWDAGFTSVTNGLHGLTGALVGGNTAFRSSKRAVLAATDVAMYEPLETTVSQGPTAFATLLKSVQRWENTPDAHGDPRIFVVMDRVPESDTQRLRLGLALACILGGAYIPYQTHADLYFPQEMYRNGRRGYLGRPTAAAEAVGPSAWKRPFEHGNVYANMGDADVVIDGVTVPPHDGVLQYVG